MWLAEEYNLTYRGWGWGGRNQIREEKSKNIRQTRGKKRKEKRGKRERAEINKERKRGENEVKVLSCGAHLNILRLRETNQKF